MTPDVKHAENGQELRKRVAAEAASEINRLLTPTRGVRR